MLIYGSFSSLRAYIDSKKWHSAWYKTKIGSKKFNLILNHIFDSRSPINMGQNMKWLSLSNLSCLNIFLKTSTNYKSKQETLLMCEFVNSFRFSLLVVNEKYTHFLQRMITRTILQWNKNGKQLRLLVLSFNKNSGTHCQHSQYEMHTINIYFVLL